MEKKKRSSAAVTAMMVPLAAATKVPAEPTLPDLPAVQEARNSGHPLARCKPRGDRVVVRRDLPRKETAGGILLPDTVANSRMPTGTIIAVGPGKRNEQGEVVPTDLKVGDRVILTGYAGLEIRDPSMNRGDQDEYVMLREDDVLALIE